MLERGQQTSVVRGEPSHPGCAHLAEVQHLQVLFGDAFHAVVDDLLDLRALLRRGQLLARAQTLEQCAVAARAGEDEHDRRQHVLALQRGDDLGPANGADLVLAARATAARTGAKAPPLLEVAAALVGGARLYALDGVLEAAVDPPAGARLEQREHLAADHYVLAQRHRAVLGNDDLGVAAHRVEPLAEFLGVGHRGGQADQAHRIVEVEDDLLPHSTPVSVRKVVDLVHHHVRETVKLLRFRIQHVAQHLCGHDHDLRGAVDAGIAGKQAHRVLAVLCD